jgi:DNA-directed RNA polymerase subunit F
MSNRAIVIDLIQKLPEDTSLHDIAREIELIAGIRKAREEAARGEGVSPEKAKQLVEQLVAAAAGEKLAAMLEGAEYLRREAALGSRADFERVLAKVPNVPPERYDALE